MPRYTSINILFIAILVMLLAACGTNDDNETGATLPLPTIAQAITTSSAEDTEEIPTPADTPTLTPTSPAIVTDAEIVTPTLSAASLTATNQPTQSPTPLRLISTELTITQPEFQAQVNERLLATSIESATVNFVTGNPQGMRIRMTAPGGQALITGDVFISFQVSGSFVFISITEIAIGASNPPAAYTEIAQEELYPLITDTFSNILNTRLGENHDLETLNFTQTTLEITLLVPE